MKFGCCCKKEQIKACAKAGFDYVELSAYELSGMSSDELQDVRRELDFYHVEMMAEPYDIFGSLMPYIEHLHISEKDPDDERCFFEDDHVSILKKAAEVLARYGYEGNISAEVPLNTFSEAAAKRSLRLMKEYLLG